MHNNKDGDVMHLLKKYQTEYQLSNNTCSISKQYMTLLRTTLMDTSRKNNYCSTIGTKFQLASCAKWLSNEIER